MTHRKSCILYRTTWFAMTLNDLEGYFSWLKPLWIQYYGNVATAAFGYCYVSITYQRVYGW